MIESIKAAHKQGIEIKCNFIYGLPGSNWGDVRRTFGFVAKMAAIGVHDIAAHPFSAYPGSAIYNQLVAEGEIVLDKKYLESLISFTDFSQIKSYCKNFDSRMIFVLCFLTMAWFYSLNFLFRPWRLTETIILFFKKKTSTRLTFATLRIIQKKKIAQLARKIGQNTVNVVPFH